MVSPGYKGDPLGLITRNAFYRGMYSFTICSYLLPASNVNESKSGGPVAIVWPGGNHAKDG